jgi:hypothetical protein
MLIFSLKFASLNEIGLFSFSQKYAVDANRIFAIMKIMPRELRLAQMRMKEMRNEI